MISHENKFFPDYFNFFLFLDPVDFKFDLIYCTWAVSAGYGYIYGRD